MKQRSRKNACFIDQAEQNAQLANAHLEDIKSRLAGFAKLQPDHPLTLANQHVLNLSAQTTWNASFAGAVPAVGSYLVKTGGAWPTTCVSSVGAAGPAGPAGTGGFGQVFISRFFSNNWTAGWPAIGSNNTRNDSEGFDSAATIMPVSCTLKNLYLLIAPTPVSAATTTPANVVLTLYKNGVATNMTVSLNSSTTIGVSTEASDLVHTVSVTAGDRLAYRYTQADQTLQLIFTASVICQ